MATQNKLAADAMALPSWNCGRLVSVRNTFLDIHFPEDSGPPGLRSKTEPPRSCFSQEDSAHDVFQFGSNAVLGVDVQEGSGFSSPCGNGMACHHEEKEQVDDLTSFLQVGQGVDVSIRNTFLDFNIPVSSGPPPSRSKTDPPSRAPLGHIAEEDHAEEKRVTSVEQVLNPPNSQRDSHMTCHKLAANMSNIAQGLEASIRNTFLNVNVPESSEPPATRSKTESPQYSSGFGEQKARSGAAGPSAVGTDRAEPAFVDLTTTQSATPTRPLQSRPTDGLTMTFISGICRVKATFPQRKVTGGDIRLVSKEFELAFGKDHPAVPFKIVILPVKTNFREGKGYVQLVYLGDNKHPAPEADVHFRISVGTGLSSSCGPWSHNFSKDFACKLERVWDFKSAACKPNALVTLEVLPSPEGR